LHLSKPQHHLSSTPNHPTTQSINSTQPPLDPRLPAKVNLSVSLPSRSTESPSPGSSTHPIVTMVHRIAFWSLFGKKPSDSTPLRLCLTRASARRGLRELFFLKYHDGMLADQQMCFCFFPNYRLGRALLAGRHRDASILQQGLPLGLPPLRGRRRELRILASGRGRQSDCSPE
jgi:hypothetical protein